ncbi:hypothetical protein FB45DRAFT_949257 [Roridomyces roridus]|uniref:Uncharacterized protein n=1 Tax=Roridomyces roridus TaxID=1738132 RepID=A0AAD7B0W6_9AGAR|nr:hypothetical protein FB45DRAFT_949257 [Roridomyces roridus]
MSHRVEESTNYSLLSQIPYFLDSHHRDPRTQEISGILLNALLLEFDEVAATGREAFVHLISLSERVAWADVRLFSQRGKFIDTLNPLFDAYTTFVDAATEAHAACAEYLFLRQKMCREGWNAISPRQIREVLGAFSRCVQLMSHRAAEIETQWETTTDALRVAVSSYCIHPSLVSIINWVDSRNVIRVDLPSLLDALPETIQKSRDGLEKHLSAYKELEDALIEGEEWRRAGSESPVSKSDIGVIFFALIHLDTAVIRYRACLLIANRWTVDRPLMDTRSISSTPLRKLIRTTELDFLVKYCGMSNPAWLSDYRFDVLTKDQKCPTRSRVVSSGFKHARRPLWRRRSGGRQEGY